MTAFAALRARLSSLGLATELETAFFVIVLLTIAFYVVDFYIERLP